jgi:hypothetical protein
MSRLDHLCNGKMLKNIKNIKNIENVIFYVFVPVEVSCWCNELVI